MREKLIDNVHSELMGLLQRTPYTRCEDVNRQYAVNWLMNNGVTVQKWIPLSEQKPGRDDLVMVFFEGMRDTPAQTQIMYGWCIGGSATHWMPLPEPPKENE
jgi:hypothetical protein